MMLPVDFFDSHMDARASVVHKLISQSSIEMGLELQVNIDGAAG